MNFQRIRIGDAWFVRVIAGHTGDVFISREGFESELDAQRRIRVLRDMDTIDLVDWSLEEPNEAAPPRRLSLDSWEW